MTIQWMALVQSHVHIDESHQHATWQPAVDVYQVPGGWVAKFEIAGIQAEDIHLEVGGCRLTLSGLRRDRLCQAAHRPHSMEITYNRFVRSIEFPENLDQAGMSVEYRDGMLIVRLTFKEGK